VRITARGWIAVFAVSLALYALFGAGLIWTVTHVWPAVGEALHTP
jgi:hypothetical protein